MAFKSENIFSKPAETLIETRLGTVPRPRRALPFKLYLITDRKLCADEGLLKTLEKALACGLTAVQLREKDLPGRELWETAVRLREITRRKNAVFFVNDRLDIALAARADGLHCPEEGPPLSAVRSYLAGKLIGKSVHTLEGAKQAQADGAGFLTFGPVFETASKPGTAPQGLSALREVSSSVKIPVLALGGITPENARACLDAGACGAAVISAVFKSADIPETLRKFESALGGL